MPVTEVIEASAAAVGAVLGTSSALSGSGVQVGKCDIHYPKEFPEEEWVGSHQSVQWDVVRFHADGLIWDNDLAVEATGYVSYDGGPLEIRPDSSHPKVPVNRFILLHFDKSPNSEDMSRGDLTVNIEPWGGGSDLAEGSAAEPWVALHVHGRFDPVGWGDIEYGFKMKVNTLGLMLLEPDSIRVSGTLTTVDGTRAVAIYQEFNTVVVRLDQHS